MRLVRRALRTAVFLLLGSSVFGMDLTEMLQSAVENDPSLKVLNAVLDNTLLGIQRARLAPGRNLELSTGDVQTAYSFSPRDGDPNWLISFSPSAALLLGRKKETQVSAEFPVAIGVDTREITVLPAVAIRQPLDKLFNGEKFSKAQEIQNRYAAEKARIDILKRVKALEQELLQRLANITSLQQQSAEHRRELAAATAARSRAGELQTYAAGSAQERQLEFRVRQVQRQQDLQQQKIELAWRELEQIVGRSLQELPEEYPELDLQPPEITGVAKNPDVFLAALAVDLEKARLKEENEPAKPKFFLGSALGTELDEDNRETTTKLAGTLDGEFEDFKFSAGIGGIVETGTLFVSVGFSWSFPDREIEGLNVKERENLLNISSWNLTSARQGFVQARELLTLEVAELAHRKTDLEEASTLAALRLEEGLKVHEAGLVTDEELEDLKWEVDRLSYVARVLDLHRLLAASRIDALTALETETR